MNYKPTPLTINKPLHLNYVVIMLAENDQSTACTGYAPCLIQFLQYSLFYSRYCAKLYKEKNKAYQMPLAKLAVNEMGKTSVSKL